MIWRMQDKMERKYMKNMMERERGLDMIWEEDANQRNHFTRNQNKDAVLHSPTREVLDVFWMRIG